jgi:S-DNA-T family DNA segregation ATPase FtsK/SpoIIIE
MAVKKHFSYFFILFLQQLEKMQKQTQAYTRKSVDVPKKPLPGRLVKLLTEAKWFIFAVFALYLTISLASYSKIDPGWSHAISVAKITNLGGRIGAWLSDILLFMFGLSAWWLCVPLLQTVWQGYRGMAKTLSGAGDDDADKHPFELVIRLGGFILLLLGSVGIEYLRLYSLKATLPRMPGGVIGELMSNLAYIPLGFTGATLLFLLMFAIGFSLYFHVSWVTIAEMSGTYIEKFSQFCLNALVFMQDKSIGLVASRQRQTSIIQARELPAEKVKIEPELLTKVIPEKSLQILRPAAVSAVVTPVSQVISEKNTVEVSKSILTNPFAKLAPRSKIVDISPVDIESNVDVEYAELAQKPIHIGQQVTSIPKSDRIEKEGQGALFSHFTDTLLPPLSLLDQAEVNLETVSNEILEFTSRLIEKKLKDFGVVASVVSAFPGPVITRYEIEPANGVKGSQIVGLARDLARALSLSSIRVVEVIPGKNYMGLELPNSKRQIVRLTEILCSKVYNDASSNLTVALGKDISGNAIVADLAKMPHLLVAGTTGSGKSVGINATILSLLYKANPNDVRMILIDPKMLELSIYEGIPHLLAPVVTDMNQAGHALNWAVGEMERRYKLMSKLGVRNLAGYNQKILDAANKEEHIANPFSLTPDAPEPLAKLPNIVIIIDELADLMMVVGKKVEELIARIAQKARAAGIHLILATQRPSVDVITGLIKANIPTRIAFQVSSKIDSRTILDQMGAEALLGMGDMLYMPPGSGFPVRVHGAFVSDEEVHRVVDYLKSQGEPNYIEGILEGGVLSDSGDATSGANHDGDETDELYDQAVAIVLKNRRASISLVQRHLRIGYNRAARLLEQMENSGLVSSMQSNGNREILAPINSVSID